MRCDALVPRATAKRATARARVVAAQRSALDDTPRHRFESRNAVVVDASSFSQRRPAALPDTRAIWSQRHVLEAGTTPYACQLCWAAFLLRTWGPRLPVFLSRCLPGTVVPLLILQRKFLAIFSYSSLRLVVLVSNQGAFLCQFNYALLKDLTVFLSSCLVGILGPGAPAAISAYVAVNDPLFLS